MPSSQISKKKLKAIVFTDMADFTTISAQDEDKALDLIQKQNEIIKPIVEKHNGEWLKEIGDGLLFSFDSSIEAVRCSIEIQENLKDIDDLNIRIGIHQGDIFIKDSDVFGDDVNIASRVEGFAPIGGISISDKVHKDISGVSDIKTSFIGHRKLKGVEQETKLRCIISNELPNPNSAYNSIIYFFGFFLMFVGSMEIINSLYNSILYLQKESVNFLDEDFRSNITFSYTGLTEILIGYNNISYVKGVSNLAQRNFVILGFAFLIFFGIEILAGYYGYCSSCP